MTAMAELDYADHAPLPRVLAENESARAVTPLYLTGNPHPDPFLARKGWKTHPSGIFARQNDGT